jgi:16S rRNA processing protein RimM
MLLVGLIRRPHGLSGELSVDVVTDFPQRFRPGVRLQWRRGGEARQLNLVGARPHGGRWLFRFEGVNGPEQARALAGGELGVPEQEAYAAPDGFYYSHRLAGWRCEDRAGLLLGTVGGLEQTPAGPLLTVQTPEGKAVLVPFVAAIVADIDEDGCRIVLEPPQGLFEL